MLSSLTSHQKNYLLLLVYILILFAINGGFYLSEIITTTTFHIPFDLNHTINIEDADIHPLLYLFKIIIWVLINIVISYFIYHIYGSINREDNMQEYQQEIKKLKLELLEYKKTIQRNSIIINDDDILKSENEYPKIHSIFEKTLEEDTAHLDYVAFFKQENNGKLIFIEQIIDDFGSKLQSKNINRTAKQQVEKYRLVASSLRETIDILNNQFAILDQRILIRTVFDVKTGGIFYYHFSDDEFLFGATIDQNKMNDDTADIQMRLLYDDIHHIIKSDPFHENF